MDAAAAAAPDVTRLTRGKPPTPVFSACTAPPPDLQNVGRDLGMALASPARGRRFSGSGRLKLRRIDKAKLCHALLFLVELM